MIILDFLFVYEHKVRELENLCLLKYELDKRGYKTRIVQIESKEAVTSVRPIYYADVVVQMACYQNSTIWWHTKNYVIFNKVIDMQWENIVYPKDEKNKNAYKNYSGIAKDVVRVSWGKMNQERMLNVVGMDSKKSKLIGHVGMDFLRKEFRGYYEAKEEVLNRYNIDTEKKIYLFISPYFSDLYSEENIETMCKRFGQDWREYYKDCMLPSKAIIIDWIEKVCKERSDIVFVYRPHPGEKSEAAEALERKCCNFRVIGELSVKQWISISEKIYTGNSSTFVEAFFADKMCYLLFPVPVPPNYELHFFANAIKIDNYEDFLKSTKENEANFPVSEELINEFYCVDKETPSYIKFANMAEEVRRNDYYKLTKKQIKACRKKTSFAYRVFLLLMKNDLIFSGYTWMISHEKWSLSKKIKNKTVIEYSDFFDNEQTTDEEILSIINKIAYLLEDNR